MIVLVTKGSTVIESLRADRWRSAAHVTGSIGMTALGEDAKLRWRGPECHETLHLHLPAATILAAIEDARTEDSRSREVSTGYPVATR